MILPRKTESWFSCLLRLLLLSLFIIIIMVESEEFRNQDILGDSLELCSALLMFQSRSQMNHLFSTIYPTLDGSLIQQVK